MERTVKSEKPVAKSRHLAAIVLHAAMTAALKAGGTLPSSSVRLAAMQAAPQDEWSQELIESNGLRRWLMYLQFFSIDAVKAGYLLKSQGKWTVSESGSKALSLEPLPFLDACTAGYKSWKAEQLHSKSDVVVKNVKQFETRQIVETPTALEDAPPEEIMQSVERSVNQSLAAELLAAIKEKSPAFFEQLVIDLLRKMGYGGTNIDAARVTGKSGDAGIDGVIDEDRLGLDSIYVQAKRWEGSVGRPDIQAFVGALQGQRAHKGVFITTSWFTKEALEFVKTIQNKVVLIDGKRLAELMIEYDLGVESKRIYVIKRIDNEFFSDE